MLAKLSRGDGPKLLLNSHLDTVPVGNGWTHDPFFEPWRDGRLYGRGANDAVTPLGNPVTASATLPVKLPPRVMLIETLPVPPIPIDTAGAGTLSASVPGLEGCVGVPLFEPPPPPHASVRSRSRLLAATREPFASE